MSPGADRAIALYRASVLKQAKYDQIVSLLEDPRDRHNLDLGGDNGVLSFLLRQEGGTWSSGDLDDQTVDAIRSVVGERVYRLDGHALPFADDSLDQIVIIDYLEHVPDDRAAVREFRRVLRPGGVLVINVPRPKPGAPLTRIRHAIGLTDEWHGHIRPGYTEAELEALLTPSFTMEVTRTYSRSFSEAIDTVLNGGYQRLRSRHRIESSRKGTVITGSELSSNRGTFRFLSLLRPILWGISRLDHLLVGQVGYKLIARARLTDKPRGDGEVERRLERARDIAPASLTS